MNYTPPSGAGQRATTAAANGHTTGVAPDQRFRRGFPCPICHGTDDDDRGEGRRCFGFLSDDGTYAHCSREDHAGRAPYNAASRTFAHRMKGPCKCGTEHAPADPKPRRKEVASYDYRDAKGRLLFQTVRYEPKDFRQRRPDGKGGWVYNRKGITPVLFHLPELRAADPAEPIVVAEGEKAVLALEKAGFVATCSPMGALKWRDEYDPEFRDRHVVVWPDNDDQGRQHAEQVTAHLLPVAASVKPVAPEGIPERGDAHDYFAAGGTAEDLRRLVEAVSVAGADDARPAIEVTTRRHEVADQAVRALAADPDLYRRGAALVAVVEEDEPTVRLTAQTTLSGTAGSPKIIALSDAVVGCHLTRMASFYAWKKDKSGEAVAVDVHPPDWLVKAVATRQHWPGIRPLVAVVECPYPRPDGTIVEAPGYDPSTGTLYRPSAAFGPVPARPTRDDARAAWQRLRALIRQFPFATPDDEVVWLAGLLTAMARPAIAAPVPGIAFIGNKAGCGKGLAIDLIGILCHGRAVPTSAYPDDKDEAQKVKVAIAVTGKSIVHFDNLDDGSTYGNSGIDSAVTAETIEDRILGSSRMTGEILLRVAWFLSGNNLAPGKDAYRRWLISNLLTPLERPEERDDIEIRDLKAHAKANRPALVIDALTILKAHARDGRPAGGWPPLGSFELWDSIVRGAAWYATDRDCCATRRKAADESPDRLDRLALLEGWRDLPGGRAGGITAKAAVDEVERSPDRYPKLRHAFDQLSRGGKPMTGRTLGNTLKGFRGNVTGNLVLAPCGEDHHALLWIVRIAGESGVSGESSRNDPSAVAGCGEDVMAHERDAQRYENGGSGHSPDSPDSPLEPAGPGSWKAPDCPEF